MRHGVSRYATYGCRCDVCCQAKSARQYAERMRRYERLKANPLVAVHGKSSTYKNWGCRCQGCTSAHSAEVAAYKERRKGNER